MKALGSSFLVISLCISISSANKDPEQQAVEGLSQLLKEIDQKIHGLDERLTNWETNCHCVVSGGVNLLSNQNEV